MLVTAAADANYYLCCQRGETLKWYRHSYTYMHSWTANYTSYVTCILQYVVDIVYRQIDAQGQNYLTPKISSLFTEVPSLSAISRVSISIVTKKKAAAKGCFNSGQTVSIENIGHDALRSASLTQKGFLALVPLVHMAILRSSTLLKELSGL